MKGFVEPFVGAPGGFFPNGISGFFSAFQIAFFAFLGIELVGTAAAETKDPYTNLPAAINRIPIRVIVFLCAGFGGDYDGYAVGCGQSQSKPVCEHVYHDWHPDCRQPD